jgi:hypothetical protein
LLALSAAAVGDILCVVCKDNAGKANKSSGVMRSVLDGRNKWEVAVVGDSVTCGGAGVTNRNGRFEVYFREANCGNVIRPRSGGMIHRRSSADGKNWDGEIRLGFPTPDHVCPIGWGDTTYLFFPFHHTPDEHMIYKARALAHGLYPSNVQLDASDHYPYQVDIVWPA